MEKKRAFFLKLFCVPSLPLWISLVCTLLTWCFCLVFFKYADPVADLLDRWGVFRARLFRESCVFHRGNYVKDLSRLGRELSKVIIVDNSPASYIFHPENAVSIQSLTSSPLALAQISWFSENRLSRALPCVRVCVFLGCRWVLGFSAKWWRTWAEWSWQCVTAMTARVLWALAAGLRCSSLERYQVVWNLKNRPSSKKQSCPAAQILFFGAVITERMVCLNSFRYSHLFLLCE